MKNKLFLTLLASASALFVGCTQQEDPCASATTFDPVCAAATPAVDSALLEINLKDSHFYDENSAEWNSVTKGDFSEPVVFKEVNLYSSVASLTAQDALASVKQAETQVATPTATVKNPVFYVKLDAKDGVSYLCSYKKIKDGVVVASMSCNFEKDGVYAYLPIVNDKLGGKLYSPTDKVGDVFLNEISIISQVGKTKSTEKKIKFYTNISTSNTNYTINLSENMADFTLNNRWSKYLAADKTNPNPALDVFKLADKLGSKSSPSTDVRVVFKTQPTMAIDEEIFYEIPMDMNVFNSSNVISISRGFGFMGHKVTLTNLTDFKYNITVGNVAMTNTSLEWRKESFPASTLLDVRFVADLNTNPAYTNPNSTALLQPLAPSCFVEKNKVYAPLSAESARDTDIAAGKYHAICHIDQKDKVVVNDPNSPSNTVLLRDSWYGHFDYIPDRASKRGLGSMYGIRRLTYRVSACLKVQARPDNDNSEASWATISSGSSNCGDNTSSSDWVYVNYTKSFSNTDDLTIYNNDPALKSLLEKLKSTGTTPDPGMKFNGEKLNGSLVRHLY